jgi:hypothetical protein
MKVIAYTALHYGAEYLAWAMRSVQSNVDEFHILYTTDPSHGHTSDLRCPETEEDLIREAHRFITKPIFWHRGKWSNESDHRSTILPIAKERGADLILWLDYDEVWDPETLKASLAEAATRPEHEIRVKFLHFWKSFGHVCSDPCMPVRIINPNGVGTFYIHNKIPVLHFGYALKAATVFYKQSIHGHKGEWKPNWFRDTYLGWKPGQEDTHPTCGRNERGEAFWIPRPTPPEIQNVLADQMSDHPYFSLDQID